MRRRHGSVTLGDFKRRRCPNAVSFGGPIYVSPGSFIVYRQCLERAEENQYLYLTARVLALALTDGAGKEYDEPRLAALSISDDLSHGYERHVDIDDVVHVFEPGPFTMWFFFGKLPRDYTEIFRASEYGGLNNRYISQFLDSNGDLSYDKKREQQRAVAERLL